MHSFLWGHAPDRGALTRALDTARGSLERAARGVGLSIELTPLTVDSVAGSGFVCRSPELAGRGSDVSSHETLRHLVLAFGDLAGEAPSSTAERLAELALERGVDALASLDGSFAAAVIDLESARVTLVSDFIGQRALRYWCGDGWLLVSPHDLCLAATGRFPIELDHVSVASAISLQWSLGGASFLSGVCAAEGDEIVELTPDGAAVRLRSPIDSGVRLADDDGGAIDRLVRELADDLEAVLRSRLDHEEQVLIALTSGMDSRGLLGPAVAVLGRERLRGVSLGRPGCRDSRVAAELARIGGIDFEVATPPLPARGAFLRVAELAAVLTNADTCAKRFLFDVAPDRAAAAKIGGQGGEIFRGVCYPPGPMPTDPRGCEQAIAVRRPLLDSLEFVDESLRHGVHDRLLGRFERYRHHTDDSADGLDLFYLIERIGRWGAEPGRLPWLTRLCTPYQDRALVRKGFRLPPGIGIRELLHRELVRRHLPRAYWIEVNGERRLPLRRFPRLDRLQQRAAHYLRAARRRLSGSPAADPESLDLEEVAASRLTHQLEAEGLREWLLRADGIGAAILAPGELERQIERHVRGEENLQSALGSLITVELFWQALGRFRAHAA